MSYVHCMPARIIFMKHGLDNIITGTVQTPDDEMVFKTRKHVVKATNRIYRGSQWKPNAGANVLIDGDVTPTGLIIDHIEPDLIGETASASPYLDELADLLPNHPPASASLRVWRSSIPYRLRWANPITGEDRKRTSRPGILHAAYDPATTLWKVWTNALDGGELVGHGIDQHALSAIAAVVGVNIAPPSHGDQDAPSKAPAPAGDPSCPF